VQTTLLGFAIVIILALLTALVGPLFVDWNSYRSEFESRASQLTGLDFHVTGAIDARLLPTPTLMLQGIEFGGPGEAGKVRARALRIEFALGALARGEWRISDAELEGPEFAAGLDRSGQLAWPSPKPGFDLDGVSIDRLTIAGGRAVLTDASSGARLVLDKLDFKGDLRSLAGPIKGEGAFVVAGQHYPYRVTTSRIGEDGAVKVRLAVDPIDRPLTVDADVAIAIDNGTPRFDGSLQLARAVGKAPAGAQSLIIEPWRVTSRIKGNSAGAVLEQIEFQYGPDDRAIKLRGSANLTFGAQPDVSGVLSSPQIDLDRMLALPEATRGRPLAAMKTLAETFTAAFRLPIPAALSIGVESVTLGGATLQRVAADVKTDPDGLDIKALEFRAPGVTQVRLSGRLAAKPAGVEFEGATRIEANDPRAFTAWLTERTDAQAIAAGTLRIGGDLKLGSDAIAIDRLKLELDRMTVTGRLAYTFARGDRPARLDAALTAPDIDLDRVHVLAKAVLGDTAFDWPREGTLSLKVARAAVAGVEAKQANVGVRIDAGGIEIEQFAIADFGGAALAVKGRIDTKGQSPRGAVTLDLDARGLDGVLALVDKFAPQAANQLRRSAGRLTPVTLRAALAVDPGAGGGAGTSAAFKVDGSAGTFRIALQGDVGGMASTSDAFRIDSLPIFAKAKLGLSGRLDADDGATLIDLLGLDRFIVADKRPGRLILTAKGPFDGELAIDGQLGVGALNVTTSGTVRVPIRTDAGPGATAAAALDLKVVNANVRSPRPAAAGRPADLLPVSGSARLALAEGTLRLMNVTGTVAGTNVGGSLAIGLQRQPMTIDGNIELGAIDLPGAIAAALRVPASAGGASANAAAPWPADPFEQDPPLLEGQVTFRSARVALTPKLAARDVRGLLHFGSSELALQSLDGSIAGGRVAGELTFIRRAEGVSAHGHVRFAGANAAELLPGDGALSGRLTLDLTAEGTGMSAVALVGSLDGGGTFTLENGRLARLDPAAFDAVIRAVDQGLPIDAIRVRDRMDAALANSGGLAVALAEGAIIINAGQARLGSTRVRAQNADLTVNGSLSLTGATLDGRLILSGMPGPGAPANTRPEIFIALKGPADAPKRSIDASVFASWLALRAVEQQSKKLDVLEGREAPPPPAAPAAGVTQTTPVQQTAPARDAAAPTALNAKADDPKDTGAADAKATDRAVPVAPNAGQPPAEMPRPRPASAPVHQSKPIAPSAEQVQPLPPPIDIRPAPTPRAPRTQPGMGAARQPPPRPLTPPAPRSLSEILFGN